MYLGNIAFLAVKIFILLLPHADNPVNTRTRSNTCQGWWAMVAAVFSMKGMEEDFVLIEYPPVTKKETLKNESHCTRQCYSCQETEHTLRVSLLNRLCNRVIINLSLTALKPSLTNRLRIP
jgi:hypothetical protein